MEYTIQEAEDVLNKSLKFANKYLEEAVSEVIADGMVFMRSCYTKMLSFCYTLAITACYEMNLFHGLCTKGTLQHYAGGVYSLGCFLPFLDGFQRLSGCQQRLPIGTYY